MKIAIPVAPVPAGTPQFSGRFGDDPERQDESFAKLLAAMLSSQRRTGGQEASPDDLAPAKTDGIRENRAPDLAPPIGTTGKSFAHARLLVETALTFPEFADAREEHQASGLLQANLQTPADALGAASSQAGKPLGDLLARWFAELGSTGVTNTRPTDPKPSCVPQPPIALASFVSQAAPVASGEQRIVHQPAGVRVTPDEAMPATPLHPSRHFSPFSAQLFALENGLRLVLRLPRMAEGERSELEAGVSRLLERFGHRRNEIVIAEIAKGES